MTTDETFDAQAHQTLLVALAASDVPERYLEFCAKYETFGGTTTNRLALDRLHKIFQSCGVQAKANQTYKVIEFDPEQVSGWSWYGTLVLQRYQGLAPMLTGRSGSRAVGSNFLSISIDAGALRTPPKPREMFLPPIITTNRPNFDGQEGTLERMVPDLVALFRHVKTVLAASSFERDTRSDHG